jgi:hypothetical protein
MEHGKWDFFHIAKSPADSAFSRPKTAVGGHSRGDRNPHAAIEMITKAWPES